MNPLHTITQEVSVGIWNSEEYIARIYTDKVIIESPSVRWVNNSGSLHISKTAIRDLKIVASINQAMVDDCEGDAWELIGCAIDDDYLGRF